MNKTIADLSQHALQLERAQEAFEAGQLDAARALCSSLLGGPELSVLNAKGQVDLLLGKVLREQGEFEQGKSVFEAALQHARGHGLHELEANALNQLASILVLQGDVNRALELLERAAELFEMSGQMTMWATALTNAGDIYRELSDYEEALTVLSKAYDFLKNTDPASRTAAINLQNLGLTYAALGKFGRAEAFYKEALEIASILQDSIVDLVSRINLAEVYIEMNKLEEAEASFEKARDLSGAANLMHYHINAIQGLGDVYARKEQFARAEAAHRQAIELAREIDDTYSLLDSLLKLTEDKLVTHAYDEAAEQAQAALLLAEQTERPRALYLAHRLLAQAYKGKGAFERAVYHLEAYHAIKEDIFNEKNADKTRRLSLKFDVEKARHEAEVYRLESELSKQAHEKAERLVQARTKELEEAQLEIVTRLAVAAEYRDDETGLHTRRVGRVAALLAYGLGWDLRRTQLLYSAARLHDVGKIGISDTILLKPSDLTDQEFDTMRSHAAIGARILAGSHSPLLKLAEDIAVAHHERWDGCGYPSGLKREAIPQAARIVAVADVLDALTHARPYKEAWSVETALEEIAQSSGNQFDPDVVAVCLKVFGASGPLSPLDIAENWRNILDDFDKITYIRNA